MMWGTSTGGWWKKILIRGATKIIAPKIEFPAVPEERHCTSCHAAHGDECRPVVQGDAQNTLELLASNRVTTIPLSWISTVPWLTVHEMLTCELVDVRPAAPKARPSQRQDPRPHPGPRPWRSTPAPPPYPPPGQAPTHDPPAAPPVRAPAHHPWSAPPVRAPAQHPWSAPRTLRVQPSLWGTGHRDPLVGQLLTLGCTSLTAKQLWENVTLTMQLSQFKVRDL